MMERQYDFHGNDHVHLFLIPVIIEDHTFDNNKYIHYEKWKKCSVPNCNLMIFCNDFLERKKL